MNERSDPSNLSISKPTEQSSARRWPPEEPAVNIKDMSDDEFMASFEMAS